MKTYISKIRKRLGHESFIHPAARIIIENEEGAFLFIIRNDNGKVGIPAGALEEGETIEQCITREVLEETGLTIHSLTLIGISSDPKREFVRYPNGDQIQYFTIEFYSNEWEGALNVRDLEEVRSVAFKDASHVELLPVNEQSVFESLEYYRKTGTVLLK